MSKGNLCYYKLVIYIFHFFSMSIDKETAIWSTYNCCFLKLEIYLIY